MKPTHIREMLSYTAAVTLAVIAGLLSLAWGLTSKYPNVSFGTVFAQLTHEFWYVLFVPFIVGPITGYVAGKRGRG